MGVREDAVSAEDVRERGSDGGNDPSAGSGL